MRRRLARTIIGVSQTGGQEYCSLPHLARLLEYKIGVPFEKVYATSENYWTELVLKTELKDLVDFIEVLHNYILILKPNSHAAAQQSTAALQFLRISVAEIFEEESIGLRIDQAGLIHFRVDRAFDFERQSLIQNLAESRFANVRERVHDAFEALDKNPADTLFAVRSIFFAAEGLFKSMFKTHQLGTGTASAHLRPVIDTLFNGSIHHSAYSKNLSTFDKWIELMHGYRHEKETPEPDPPPEDLAISILSQGVSWVRWLASIDQRISSRTDL